MASGSTVSNQISNIAALNENLQRELSDLSKSMSQEYYDKFSFLNDEVTENINTAKKDCLEKVSTFEDSLKLPYIEYDGRTSLNDFLKDIFSCGNGWNEEEKVAYIISALRGPAAEVLLDLNDEECLNYQMLVDALQKKHEMYVADHIKVTDFFKRTQITGESVQDYGADVKHLGSLAFKGVSEEIANFYIVKHFFVGLAKTTIINSLILSNVQFNNIDEAIQEVVKMERVKSE